jgi:hypothetical protein
MQKSALGCVFIANTVEDLIVRNKNNAEEKD